MAQLIVKYPAHLLFAPLAVAALILFIAAFRKKEKIIALFRLPHAVRFKALRAALLGFGLGLFIIALLGPQYLSGYTQVHKTGLDIYVLMDTSKSMLVADTEPDRLTVAKKIVDNLLDNLQGDRVGFIPFASDAYIQMPLTDDYALARMFLNVMDTDMISGGGTNLASAIRLANDSLDRSSQGDRVILILSDGEEHEGSSLDSLKAITDERTKIFTVGVGTERGGLVPVIGDGGAIYDYMRDGDGNPVTSRLHADTLKELARLGRGAYYQASAQGNEPLSLIEALADLKRDEMDIQRAAKYKHLYQYFLGAGLLMIAAAWFLPERRRDA